MTLQTKFQELVALALSVGDWEVGFGLAVGGTDDVCGLVYATLEFAYLVLVTGTFHHDSIWEDLYLCSHRGEGWGRLDQCSGCRRFPQRRCTCSTTRKVSKRLGLDEGDLPHRVHRGKY